MGEYAQKRLIRKIDLEKFLCAVKPHPWPNAKLEQYTTSEAVTATILYLAAYNYGDIIGKKVVDLGCGTGRLSLASAFLGANPVVGVDIDRAAIKVAVKNSERVDLKGTVNWIIGDIDSVTGEFDTVIQNPPFGVQKHAADRRFIEKALQLGNTVYSLHNHPYEDKLSNSKRKGNSMQLLQGKATPFLQRLIERYGGRIEAVYALPLIIPRMFDFHAYTKHKIMIDLYIIKKE